MTDPIISILNRDARLRSAQLEWERDWRTPLEIRVDAERASRFNASQGAVTGPEQLAYIAGLKLRKAIADKAAEPVDVRVTKPATVKECLTDGWIAWEPSYVLTPAGVLSHIRFEDGEEREVRGIETDPRDWCWSRKDGDWGQITHYRIAKPAQAEPAAITPEVLRAAFERAGVTSVEGCGDAPNNWLEDGMNWEFTDAPHCYRPGPSTPPDVLARFYSQFEVTEVLDISGGYWHRMPSEDMNYKCPTSAYRLPTDAKLTNPLPATGA